MDTDSPHSTADRSLTTSPTSSGPEMHRSDERWPAYLATDLLLVIVFAAIAVLALLLSFDTIVPFTVGALGCAAALGLGNGAVFKLVPEYFPKETGVVTGLVGAFGGLGGFFPPLELGLIKDAFGSYTLGFALLSVFSLVCLVVNYLSFLKKADERGLPIEQATT